MPKEIKTKQTFGGATIEFIRPALPAAAAKALNVHMRFEETLKFWFSLGQLLGQLNSYKRSTRAGKLSCANICIHVNKNRVTVQEGKLRRPGGRTLHSVDVEGLNGE